MASRSKQGADDLSQQLDRLSLTTKAPDASHTKRTEAGDKDTEVVFKGRPPVAPQRYIPPHERAAKATTAKPSKTSSTPIHTTNLISMTLRSLKFLSTSC